MPLLIFECIIVCTLTESASYGIFASVDRNNTIISIYSNNIIHTKCVRFFGCFPAYFCMVYYCGIVWLRILVMRMLNNLYYFSLASRCDPSHSISASYCAATMTACSVHKATYIWHPCRHIAPMFKATNTICRSPIFSSCCS